MDRVIKKKSAVVENATQETDNTPRIDPELSKLFTSVSPEYTPRFDANGDIILKVYRSSDQDREAWISSRQCAESFSYYIDSGITPTPACKLERMLVMPTSDAVFRLGLIINPKPVIINNRICFACHSHEKHMLINAGMEVAALVRL